MHAGINAGDAICVTRLAQRAAGQEHDQNGVRVLEEALYAGVGHRGV